MAAESRGDWSNLIGAARARLPAVVSASRYDRPAQGSGSEAQYFTCSDGFTYVVKFIGNRHGTRSLATEQVVASLATHIGAPIPPVAHIDVPAGLIAAQGLRIFDKPAIPGVQHGSRVELDCTDREALRYHDEPANKPRFAGLSVLYAWLQAGDHQWIYRKQEPHLVFSVDHGMFFPGSNNWTAATLASATTVQMDPQFAAVHIEKEFYAPCIDRLRTVTGEVVATAVARILPEWGVPEADQIALADFVIRRADETATLFDGMR